MRRTGKFSLIFDHTPRVESTGTIVGKKEADGPLGRWFDIKSDDSYFTQKTWEQAEAIIQQTALLKALEKTGLDASSLDMVFSGDLENQCIASSFGVKALSVPFVGLYGACSTMALSLALAGLFIESGGGQDGRGDILPFLHRRKAISLPARIRRATASDRAMDRHRSRRGNHRLG